MPTRPLAKTQPQLGKGLMVSAKMTLEMPSTIKNTIKSSVMIRSPLSGCLNSSTPMRMAITTEISCNQ
jgi:hypothetical protein